MCAEIKEKVIHVAGHRGLGVKSEAAEALLSQITKFYEPRVGLDEF